MQVVQVHTCRKVSHRGVRPSRARRPAIGSARRGRPLRCRRRSSHRGEAVALVEAPRAVLLWKAHRSRPAGRSALATSSRRFRAPVRSSPGRRRADRPNRLPAPTARPLIIHVGDPDLALSAAQRWRTTCGRPRRRAPGAGSQETTRAATAARHRSPRRRRLRASANARGAVAQDEPRNAIANGVGVGGFARRLDENVLSRDRPGSHKLTVGLVVVQTENTTPVTPAGLIHERPAGVAHRRSRRCNVYSRRVDVAAPVDVNHPPLLPSFCRRVPATMSSAPLSGCPYRRAHLAWRRRLRVRSAASVEVR